MDDTTPPAADTPPPDDSAPERARGVDSTPPRRGFFRRHWLGTTLTTLVGLPVLVFVLWTAVALSWSYSTGKRAGYVQKMSRKGWLCKTWEGTLYTDIARGFRADSFVFTVRSDSLAHAIEALSGKRVAVAYQQHIGVPTSCFGDTEYFVVGVSALSE